METYTSSGGAESSCKFITSSDGTKASSKGLLGASFFESLVWESENNSYNMIDSNSLVQRATILQVENNKEEGEGNLSIINRSSK